MNDIKNIIMSMSELAVENKNIDILYMPYKIVQVQENPPMYKVKKNKTFVFWLFLGKYVKNRE